jgi:hypothetical protein
MFNSIKKDCLFRCFSSLLLAFTIGVNLFGIQFSKTVSKDTIVRTVQLENSQLDTQAVLDTFVTYDLESDGSNVTFTGVKQFDIESLSQIDSVSLDDIAPEDINNVQFDLSFLEERMQFVFSMKYLDSYGKTLAEENEVSDAIVTPTGGLDALIHIFGEEILLSEYVEQLKVEEDAWWTIAIAVVKIIVPIVVVYVIVAETAEQIKAGSNYTYNKNLETSNNGVAKGNYITNQRESSLANYRSGNYRFGFTTFSGVGCEVASVYNLLIGLSKAEMLSETIYNFERWAIEFSVAWGNLGSNPLDIYRYLSKKSIPYTKYTSYSSFKTALSKKSSFKVIMSTWNEGSMLNSIVKIAGLHTYYIDKISSSSFKSYNFESRSIPKDHGSIDEIYNDSGDFIVAYIIGL